MNNLPYDLCLKLKDIGVEQIGGDGWYCEKCGWEMSVKEEILHENCVVNGGYPILAIPSLSQLLEVLEGEKERFGRSGLQITLKKSGYEVCSYALKFDVGRFKDKHLPTALAKLIIELKETQ